MKVGVREAVRGDIPVIVRFNRAMALETEKRVLSAATLKRGVTAVIDHPARGVYYVAETPAGRVIGQLLITYEWSDWRNGQFWWVQSVYVEPPFRGRGVFRALLAEVRALADAREDVCGFRLYVESANRAARRTYRRLGFSDTGYRLMEIDDVLGPE